MLLLLVVLGILYYGAVYIFLIERHYMSKRNLLIDLIPGGAIMRFLFRGRSVVKFLLAQIKESYEDLP